MTIASTGTIYLNSVQLTIDPDVYEPVNWTKRASQHMAIGGGRTIQDFGRYAKDLEVHLSSGPTRYVTKAVVDSITALQQTRGATYTLTDWMGNEFTVWVSDWKPVPAKFQSYWTYTLTLRVVTITKLYGSSYTGS